MRPDLLKDETGRPILSPALLLVVVLFVCLTLGSAYLTYQLYGIVNQLSDTKSRHFEMAQAADELRQSAHDLSRMAREYSATSDRQYLVDFHRILAIRQGDAPRPKAYRHIYWDLTPAQRSQWHPDEAPRSFQRLVSDLPFSAGEKLLLSRAEESSNELAAVEEQAFNAMEGLFLDADGEYTVRGVSRPIYARQILYSDLYQQEKSRIMLLLDRLLLIMNRRFEGEILSLELQENRILTLLPVLCFVNLMIFLITIRLAHQRLQQFHSQLKLASLTDSLTGIPNRRSMDIKGNNLVAIQQRYDKPLAALMIDIDFFKKINDNFGHQAGDAVIKQVAECLRGNIRDSDLLARMGGEEYAILLPESGPREAANFADRICRLIANSPCYYKGRSITYTISVGMSSLHKNQTLDELLGHADTALYQAKASGRNQVCVETRLNHFVPHTLHI